jgi:hypothetical protein
MSWLAKLRPGDRVAVLHGFYTPRRITAHTVRTVTTQGRFVLDNQTCWDERGCKAGTGVAWGWSKDHLLELTPEIQKEIDDTTTRVKILNLLSQAKILTNDTSVSLDRLATLQLGLETWLRKIT